MKDTGIIRKIDELGRIVLPKELRNSLNINSGDDLQIYVDTEKVILKKYSVINNNCAESSKLLKSVEDLVDCSLYITDKDIVITESDLKGEKVPRIFKLILDDRKSYESSSEEDIIFSNKRKKGYYYVEPIIQDSNANGLVMLIKNSKITDQDKFFAKIIKNIIEKR